MMSALAPSDPAFIVMACAWMQRPEDSFLGFVWAAYDALRRENPYIDTSDLERSITQLLEPRVRDAMSGDEPFYVQHGPFERETKAAAPAQPPEYDLAFVLRADARIMWPLEAKVLETPRSLAAYVRDVHQEFLNCRYAPFASSGAMIGYLLSGVGDDALHEVARSLGCVLETVTGFERRPNRVSGHSRTVPRGKAYPDTFRCYHLMLEFPGLKRTATAL